MAETSKLPTNPLWQKDCGLVHMMTESLNFIDLDYKCSIEGGNTMTDQDEEKISDSSNISLKKENEEHKSTNFGHVIHYS